jgi:hypothetical protein
MVVGGHNFVKRFMSSEPEGSCAHFQHTKVLHKPAKHRVTPMAI